MHTVIWQPSALRDLGRIPSRVAPAIIEFVLGAVAATPRRVGKPLQHERAGLFSARRGEYRVIYLIDDDRETVVIHAVGHRSDIYRRP